MFKELSAWLLERERPLISVLRSGMFIPDTDFFHPGSRIRIKEFKYFNPKIVSKLSEI
jgi:hypothetical protein